MNRNEYLLTCLMEESAEVIQAVSKCLRFGKNDFNPTEAEALKNVENVAREFIELSTVVGMLAEEKYIPEISLEFYELIREQKREKLNKWMEYSKENGCLQDDK